MPRRILLLLLLLPLLAGAATDNDYIDLSNETIYKVAPFTLTARSAVADRLVDPTRPSNARVAVAYTPDVVHLEAILRSSDRELAIVNGKIVRVGDRVGEARIDAILPDSVRYTRDGKSYVARLEAKSIDIRHNETHDTISADRTRGEDHE